MNLILLSRNDFPFDDQHIVRFEGRRLQHILSIQRAQKGDTLRVGVINGNCGTGLIQSITDSCIEMTVVLDTLPPPPLGLILVCALARPKTIKKVIQCATALGIKKIFFIRTWRVEKSYLNSPLFLPDALAEQCILGLEQACDTMMPSIALKPLFKPFIEDEIPGLIQNSHAIVAHPTSSKGLIRDFNDNTVTLAIGPEGGFVDYEIAMLEKHGFESMSLGKRIQRVEFALPYCVGKLF